MKKYIALALLAFTFALTGCSTEPTALERKFYNIVTNPPMERIVWKTNVIPVTNVMTLIITNNENQVITNNVFQVFNQTNVFSVTNLISQGYTYTPNTNAALTKDTAIVVGNSILPGAGTVAGAIVSGLFGVWGLIRSRKANTVSATLAQGIEVYGEVVKTIQGVNGQDIDAKVKQWLQQHQAETGTIQAVLNLLNKTVDNEEARKVAAELQEFLTKKQGG